ncbi:MAG: RluA family pseudouridine synthase [Polyangiaceae bacterium]|nr:RluA family pseudouridine synthase [Polyangiaceae bacterium]
MERHVVATEDAGTRVDVLVARLIPALSRRRAAALCMAGAVTIDGRSASKGDSVQAGVEIAVLLPGSCCPLADPDAPLTIVLERPDLVIVDKPAAQPTAPLRHDERGTLVNALLGRFPDLADVGFGGFEPGIIHRLDNHTSGLVIAARRPEAFARLRVAITRELLEKRYLAIVEDHGLAETGVVTGLIVPDPKSARRVRVVPPGSPARGARPATTRWGVVSRRGGLALLEVTAPRAVRHQIRAHLSEAGHPILGDALYGGSIHSALSGRHALHASQVCWVGDAVVSAFAAVAPLPPELEALL